MTIPLPASIQRLLVFLVIFCPASIAAAGESFSVNGMKLGERIDSVFNDPAYECGGEAGCFLYTVCTRKQAGTGVVADDIPLESIALHYTGERLTAIEVRFPAQRFDEVASTLGRLHGALASDPHKTGDESIRVWKQGREVLRLERVLRAGPASSLILSDRSFLSELVEP